MSPRPSTADVHAALATDLSRWFGRRVPADQVDDLVQDTFVRIHRGLPGLRDTDKLTGWVYQVARGVLVDSTRRMRPTPTSEDRVLNDVLTVEQPDLGPDPTEVVAGWLPAMVDELPEPYRAAVRLSELEGMTQAELAKRLGLSASGARSRVQRGRKLLAERLDACCHIARQGAEVVDWHRRRSPCTTSCEPR